MSANVPCFPGVCVRRELRADVERLRAALAGLVDWNRHRYPPQMGGGEFPPSLAPLMDAASRALGDVEVPR